MWTRFNLSREYNTREAAEDSRWRFVSVLGPISGWKYRVRHRYREQISKNTGSPTFEDQAPVFRSLEFRPPRFQTVSATKGAKLVKLLPEIRTFRERDLVTFFSRSLI